MTTTTQQESQKAAALIRERIGDKPVDFAIVLGMGMGTFPEHLAGAVTIPFSDLPGFPVIDGERPGSLTIGGIGSQRVAVFDGRARVSSPDNARALYCALETMTLLGATGAIVTGAVGSMRQDIKPGAIITIRDHINFSGINPLRESGHNERRVDLRRAYDFDLRERFYVAAGEIGRKVPEAVHFLMAGPSFETPAEVAAARMLGGEVIGMSIVPEVIIGRALGLRMMAVAIVTNFAAELNAEPITREQVHRVASASMVSLTRILVRFCEIWRLGSAQVA